MTAPGAQKAFLPLPSQTYSPLIPKSPLKDIPGAGSLNFSSALKGKQTKTSYKANFTSSCPGF